MELKKGHSPLFILSAIWVVLLSLLGSWWLYLIFQLSTRLTLLEGRETGPNIARLIKWEGSAFIILVILVSFFYLYLFFKDQRKNKSIQAFFAGLTHELKTPLASIKLQAEVIQDEVERIENQRLDKLANRLIADTSRLETQMDKILQLSRVERGGELNLTSIPLKSFLENSIKKQNQNFKYKIENLDKKTEVLADHFALEIIFKNLVENTKNHAKSEECQIKCKIQDDTICITYSDKGLFTGDLSKIGKLFYKHNSTKGSGIGLYLSKKLLSRMKGQLNVIHREGLQFQIILPLSKGEGVG